jgi:MFS family permease
VPRHRRDSDPHPVPAHKRGFFHNVWISFKRVSFSNMHVLSCCVAGLVSALKDGIVWGLLPIFFHRYDPDIEQISLLIALYPTTWAVVQLFSGWLYDRYGARWLIASGCWLEGFAILYVVWCPRLLLRDLPPSQSFYVFLTGSVLLGTGTALLYPTLHVAISHGVPPKYFASSIGIYKLWRELGYATGALLGGGVADAFGISAALTVGAVMIFVVGLLTCAFIADDRDEEMITMEELSSRICGSNPDAAEAVRRSGERTEEVSESDADDRVVPPRGIAPARPPVIM